MKLIKKEVENIKPNIKWNGGKGRELKTILPKLPQNFSTYIEPFFGGGGVILGNTTYQCYN